MTLNELTLKTLGLPDSVYLLERSVCGYESETVLTHVSTEDAFDLIEEDGVASDMDWLTMAMESFPSITWPGK